MDNKKTTKKKDIFSIENIIKASENIYNETIMKTNRDDILKQKINIFDEIGLDKKQKKELLAKLKNYRYINDLSELQYGRYIRWIDLTKTEFDEIELAKGSIFSDFRIDDEKGIQIICKNMYGKHFQLNFDSNLFFQKLTSQELILLRAIDLLDK